MIVQDQRDVIAFLCAPDGGAGAERITTHISELFLFPDEVLKLKRAVRLPYVDFSTPQRRLEACRAEVERNRRTAPDLYLGVRAITRTDDGGLALDGKGQLVDAVVAMRRFDQRDLLVDMADDGRLTADIARAAADAIAAFHAGLQHVPGAGGASLMRDVLAINRAALAEAAYFPRPRLETLDRAFRAAFGRLRGLLDSRGDAIVLGHGDLHLRNIFLADGRPTLFDAIEFNDAIATVDRLYDLAFLLMDLWYRGYRNLANVVANRYADRMGEEPGFGLLPFFMAVRAAVRAHVTAEQIHEDHSADPALARRAERYFDLARALLAPPVPRLIAIGGLSGSGKSTVAEALAPAIAAPPGARIVESDRLRKWLFGVPPETHLPPSAYDSQVGERVYAAMVDKAGILLREDCTVLAVAVYNDASHRAAMEQVARHAGVPFSGFWLHAPESVLRSRVGNRRGSASDAGLAVLDRQLGGPPVHTGWNQVDATGDVATIVAAIDRLANASP